MLKINELIKQIKQIFIGYETPRCVGLDIGSYATKMVELEPGSLLINKYNICPLEKGLVSEGVINDIEKVSDHIREQWERFYAFAQSVAIAIPYNSIIIREIHAPLFPSKYELDAYVLEQLVKTLDMAEIDFDYQVLSTNKEEQLLMVVVAKKEKIEEYQALIQMTGINVAVIEIEPFAFQHLVKFLLNQYNITKQVLILDLGQSKIRGYVFEEKAPLYFIEVAVNYATVVEELANNYKPEEEVSFEKITHLYRENNLELLNPLIHTILGDINRLIQSLRSNLLVDKGLSLQDNLDIYLIGGNSIIYGLAQAIEEKYMGSKVLYLIRLLQNFNPQIDQVELAFLFNAIALATWGQKWGV